MAITPDTQFDEFMNLIARKFQTSPNRLVVKFQDEDGGNVTLEDESDFELAVETVRANSNGRSEGRLDIWCQDL